MQDTDMRGGAYTHRVVRVALWVLVVHSVLLFFFGGRWSLGFFMLPLWITALTILITVPWAIVALSKTLAGLQGSLASSRRQCHFVRGLLILASLFYTLCPGGLFCYPLSDLGFRWTIGNRLQACVVQFLEKPDRTIKKKEGFFSTIVDRSAIPPCLANGGVRYSFVTIAGSKPEDRHLGLICGGGFGHWGLYIGAPSFRLSSKPTGVRQMWDGVYAFRSE
jgi:hypothetical protein